MRVVVADDETLLRQGLVALLEQSGFAVVADVPDADALLASVDELDPDVVITDIRMPPGGEDDGLRAARRIRVEHPATGVLVLSHHVQRRYAVELVGESLRGVGYLLKQRIARVDDFCHSVRQVGSGGTALDPTVIDLMMARAARDRPDLERLTPRQTEVLSLVAEGRSNAAIATRLYVSEKAVVQHISRIYDALGLPVSDDDHRRVLAVLRYLSVG